MYVRTGATYYPVNNLTNGTLQDKYQPFITTGPFNNQLCALPNLPGVGGNMPLGLMKQIVQDSLPYSVFAAEAAWQNKKRVFEQLKQTPGLMNNEPILQNFFTTEQNYSIGQVPQVEEEIQAGNLLNAQSVNNNIVPYYIPDNNHKTFNEVYVDALLSYGIKNIDSLQIQAITQIAEQCPTEAGEAVWHARTLLNTYYNDALVFADSCPFNNNARVLFEQDMVVSKQAVQCKIVPNPNNGEMTLYYNLPEMGAAEVIIYDVFGKVVYKVAIDTKKIMRTIELEHKASGMYYYKIMQSENVQHSGKFIITH